MYYVIRIYCYQSLPEHIYVLYTWLEREGAIVQKQIGGYDVFYKKTLILVIVSKKGKWLFWLRFFEY